MKQDIAGHGIITIDCNYTAPGHAAAYLLLEKERAAFVDNNTAHAAPLLMGALDQYGLRPEQVDSLIITHLHLDHAGGTSSMVRHCPNAQVLCHPAAVRHLLDPSRLVASVKRVYGEKRFAELYGVVEPIAPERVRAVEDGEAAGLGDRVLTFMHTPGHAKHHICIHDTQTGSVFVGDMFGVMHASPLRCSVPCLFFSTAPTDFDPARARESIRRIRETGAARVYMTHFGVYEALERGESQLLESIAASEAILQQAFVSDLGGDALRRFCEERVRAAFTEHFTRWHIPMQDHDWRRLDEDIRINAMGLAYLVEKRRADLET
jgi:glyoxylase-like metal-dependent hydrolase (beta-lactamase superfamily II)